MYLVKALRALTAPIAPGVSVAWAEGQVCLVDPRTLASLVNRTDDFELVAGPDFSAVTQEATGVRTGAAAPTDYAAAVKASRVVASTGANNDLTFEAVTAGAAGNDFSVEIVQGTGVSAPLSVVYSNGKFTIQLPTDELEAPVAVTATQVKTEWDTAEMNNLVTVTKEGTGAGTVEAAAEVSLQNGADEVAGTQGGPGSLYVSTTEKKLYINTGTAAEPVWEVFTSA